MPSLFEISEEQRAALSALFDVGATVVSASDHQEALEKVLGTVAELTGATICSLRVLDEKTGDLNLVASLGLSREFLEVADDVKLGESVVGRAVKEKKPYPIDNIDQSPFKFTRLAREQNLRSLLSVPLMLHGKASGGLTIYSQKHHHFTDSEIRVMSAIAGQLAVFLENASLYKDMVESLSTLMIEYESKSRFFTGHSARVTHWSVALGRATGLESSQLWLMERMAPLHDIGMIHVRGDLLERTDPLSDAELGEIRRHVEIGEAILRPIKLFGPGLHMIRNHHEWFDGTGYPDGLKGVAIPKAARILAIAEAFEAMTHPRPYREEAKPPGVAAEELMECAETQFDPVLVEKFLQLLKTGELGTAEPD